MPCRDKSISNPLHMGSRSAFVNTDCSWGIKRGMRFCIPHIISLTMSLYEQARLWKEEWVILYCCTCMHEQLGSFTQLDKPGSLRLLIYIRDFQQWLVLQGGSTRRSVRSFGRLLIWWWGWWHQTYPRTYGKHVSRGTEEQGQSVIREKNIKLVKYSLCKEI